MIKVLQSDSYSQNNVIKINGKSNIFCKEMEFGKQARWSKFELTKRISFSIKRRLKQVKWYWDSDKMTTFFYYISLKQKVVCWKFCIS